jgi:HAD superfamily hydrolase (TIGR01509 family)
MAEETVEDNPASGHGKGVLWDLDGTLVDSAEFHWLSWRDTLAAEGHHITYQQFLDSFGQKNDRILPLWLGPDTPVERMTRIGDAKEAEYRRLARTHGLTALPGASEWVHRLHERGWKQAIASSAPRQNVEVMLEVLGVDHDFDAIVGAEDVTAGKPDPQVFLTAAAKLGLPPERCVVVEDAAAGIEAARRAGMRSIGVSRSAGLDADVVVRSLADLGDRVFEEILAIPDP